MSQSAYAVHTACVGRHAIVQIVNAGDDQVPFFLLIVSSLLFDVESRAVRARVRAVSLPMCFRVSWREIVG